MRWQVKKKQQVVFISSLGQVKRRIRKRFNTIHPPLTRTMIMLAKCHFNGLCAMEMIMMIMFDVQQLRMWRKSVQDVQTVSIYQLRHLIRLLLDALYLSLLDTNGFEFYFSTRWMFNDTRKNKECNGQILNKTMIVKQTKKI